MIEINNLFFSCDSVAHGNEKIILNGINMSVTHGESVLIAGNNRSGKSSLLSIINGRLKPLVGTVKVNGRSVSDLSKVEIKQMISTIDGNFSNFVVQDLTFIENLYLYTMKDNRISPFNGLNKARVIELIDYIKELNVGIDIENIAHVTVRELPLFYSHLLLLLIATINNPKIVLLDNVFDNIEINDIKYVFPILKNLCHAKKFTVLLTTENTYTINKICDRVVVISNGSIVFDEKSGTNIDIAKVTDLFNQHLSQALNETSTTYHGVHINSPINQSETHQTLQGAQEYTTTQQTITPSINTPHETNLNN